MIMFFKSVLPVSAFYLNSVIHVYTYVANAILMLTTQSWVRFHKFNGTVPHKTALLSDISCKLGVSPTIHTFDKLATNSGIPTTTSGSVILSNNSKKLYVYNYSFIIYYKHKLEKTHKERSGGSKCEASQSSACITLLAYQFLSPTRNLTLTVSIHSFYCGFIMWE